jgi:hypothetical protein
MTDTPDWNQDAIDERVRALAAEHYHRPPPEGSVPRDAMWATIAPAWQAERVVVAAPRRESAARTARWRWSAALAAGLIIGIALDRGVESYLGSSRAAVTPQRTAGVTVVPTPPNAPAAAERVTEPASIEQNAPREERRLAVREPQRAEVPSSSGVEPTARAPRGASARTLYQAAAVQTLAQAEALLTSYRRGDDMVGGRDQEAMRQAARWARDVLSSTRLLLDSPASRDPQLRALLSDLELVLAQIVQVSGAPLQAGERELIEHAMRDRDLLPRLRSAVPAGSTTS